MKILPFFLISLFLMTYGGPGGQVASAKSEYTTCHGCGKYGVDVEVLAQTNIRARHRSTVIRGSHTYPGCQGVDSEFICFVSGKNLFCGSKKAWGVITTNSTYFCTNFGARK